MDFGEEIDEMVSKFPNYEMFVLSSQLRCAADSVALNVAEGSIGQSKPEQKKIMAYSIRSLAEVVTCLHKAKRRNYINEEEFQSRYLEAFNLMNMRLDLKIVSNNGNFRPRSPNFGHRSAVFPDCRQEGVSGLPSPFSGLQTSDSGLPSSHF